MHLDKNFQNKISNEDRTHISETNSPARIHDKKRIAFAFLCLCAVLLLAVGSLGIAYLTDTQKASNEFTVSTDGISVSLIEEHWDKDDENGDKIPDVSSNLVPRQVVSKDPSMVNHSDMDVYVFMTVRIPLLTCTADDALYIGEGKMPAAADKLPLFKLGSGTSDADFTETISDKWIEYGEPVYSTEEINGETQEFATHTYLYKEKLPAAADGTAPSTDVLFESVQFANVSEKADYNPTDILIKGYAVQALGFEDDADMEADGAQAGYMKAWRTYQDGKISAVEAH